MVSNFTLILEALINDNEKKYSGILKEFQEKINTIDISKRDDID
jgi:hypothetical protein